MEKGIFGAGQLNRGNSPESASFKIKDFKLHVPVLKDHYKLIAIDLSKQIELENPDLQEQINFIGRVEENNATMFFIIEKKEETTFYFSQNSVLVV